MLIPRLIERKRDGGALTPDEWAELIRRYVAGDVPDYQMSALLMAVFFRGLDTSELGALTDAMLASGDRFRFDGWATPRVDKHSTGGVGDKTNLLIPPMVAAAGVAVPMVSGRGLGHTGGTLDKLESIPGFRTDLPLRRAEQQVRELGVVLIGQTPELAPADKSLYALRDVTATVESLPLIAASIMSKKLAEGLNALVLDVKTGSGAFLPEPSRGLELARTMVALGEERGCTAVALLTAMDRPLGYALGNALEVKEAIAGLKGDGPADLMEVTYALAAEMLLAAGVAPTIDAARMALERTVETGAALERLRQVIAAQGGDSRVVDDQSLLPSAPVTRTFSAPEGGVVAQVEPRALGHAIVALGGGRRTVDDMVDPAVGFEVPVKPGQRVEQGDVLGIVHARTDSAADEALVALAAAIRIGEPMAPAPLISHRVTIDGTEVLG
jgi:pyrimidine-nucleoside phosphorylase